MFTQLAHAIEEGDKQKCEDIWRRILPSLRDEYSLADPVFLRLYDFVEDIVFKSLDALKERGFREKLLELAPLLSALDRAADVIGELSRIFLKEGLDNKLKYYAACVLYAIDVEGQFVQACRVLYLLYKSSTGEVISLSEIENLSLRKIREELKTLTHGESEILFLGWEDNHLRNAIFHMRIKYDNSSTEMSFEDYDMSKGNVSYDEKLTYSEFSRLTHLINGVSFVFLFIMMILSARDMAFANELP